MLRCERERLLNPVGTGTRGVGAIWALGRMLADQTDRWHRLDHARTACVPAHTNACTRARTHTRFLTLAA